MSFVRHTLSISLVTASLLTGTSLGASRASAAPASLEAKTGWAVSRVASMSQGSYCTMAQKFSNDTVMTIANNDSGEYSVAFDFQAPKFQVGKSTAASLRAGTGSTQTYEVEPQTPNAIVIPLGTDKGFVRELQKSGRVQLDIGGASYTFNTAKFPQAVDEMSTCMSAGKPAAREAKALQEPVVTAAVPSSTTTNPANPSADPMVSDNAARPLAAVAPAAAPTGQDEQNALQVENARLKQALADSRRTYENQVSSQASQLPELQEKLRGLESENARLKQEISQQTSSAAAIAPKADLSRLAAELNKTRQELAKATEENKSAQTQMAELRAKAAAPAAATVPVPAPLISEQDLAALKTENAGLKSELEARAKKISELENKKPPVVFDAAAADDIAKLRAENKKLQDELAAKAVPATDTLSADPESLREQIRDLKSQIQIMETQNTTLNQQLETAQKDAEGQQLKAVGGNWDLEQATRRYQESQREIRRLGALLEEDRAKCKAEKKDIEYMLFDPEIAKPAQISMLDDLEKQVEDRNSRIAELEEALRNARVQPASGNARADIVEENSSSVKTATMETAQSANAVTTVPAQPVKQQEAALSVEPTLKTAKMTEQQPMAARVTFQSQSDFSRILQSAGIGVQGNVKELPGASETYKAYSWKTDSLFGAAEQRAVKDKGAFEKAVQNYIGRAKSRCSGKFAAIRATVKGTPAIPAEGYDIACVGGQSGSAASVLFTYKDGVMTTLAHEGRSDAMNIAMDVRNKVAVMMAAN